MFEKGYNRPRLYQRRLYDLKMEVKMAEERENKIDGLQNKLYINDEVVSHYVMGFESIDGVVYAHAGLITEDSRWLGTITFSPYTKESRIRWSDDLINLVPNVDICEIEKQIRENEKDSFWGKFIGG